VDETWLIGELGNVQRRRSRCHCEKVTNAES
jgi:hypothetical protein